MLCSVEFNHGPRSENQIMRPLPGGGISITYADGFTASSMRFSYTSELAHVLRSPCVFVVKLNGKPYTR